MSVTAGVGRPRLWYHGWNIVGIAILGQVAALALTFNCFSLFLHDWTVEFHVPVSALALAISLFSIVCIFTAPIIGIVADRFPARLVYGFGLVALSLSYGAVGLATGRWQILAIYGAILPFVIVCSSSVQAQALVSRWFVRRVGLAMGLTAFGATLGGVVFPPIVVWLLPLIGWRHVWFLFGAVILFVVLPLALLIARNRPGDEEGAYYVGDGRKAAAQSALRWRDIFRRRNFWVTIGVFVPAQCCYMGLSINLAPLAASRGFGPEYAGALLSLLSFTPLAGKLCAGLVVDRWGNRLPLIATPSCCALGMTILALTGAHLAPFMIGIGLVGLAGAMWTLLASATAAEFGADGFGRAFGLISAATPLASLTAPLLARVQESTGNYFAGLIGLGLFALVGAIIGSLFKDRRPTLFGERHGVSMPLDPAGAKAAI